jgi:hypothetical protein
VTPAVSDKTPRSVQSAQAGGQAEVQCGRGAGAAAHRAGTRQQLQQADAGYSGMGQAMSSLFDMLADDEDSEQQQQQQQPILQQQLGPHMLQQAHISGSHLAVGRQPFLLTGSPGVAAGRAPPPQAELQREPAASASPQQQQPNQVRQPLAELQLNQQAPAQARLAASQLLPHDRASASAIFGAAVQRSLRNTRSMPGTLSPTGAASTAAHLSLAAAVHRRGPAYHPLDDLQPPSQQGYSGSAWGALEHQPAQLQEPSQQLMTPPHQVRSVFGQPASAATGVDSSHGGSSVMAAGVRPRQAGRQQAGADWGTDNSRRGNHARRDLPDFSKFAFSTGVPLLPMVCT